MQEVECERGFEDENFEKTTYIIGKLRKIYVENAYHTIFLSTFEYHKHELEMARFGACAPRAGTVDVKRLIFSYGCKSWKY